MVECFLLLRQADARWIPLVAIPAVLAGGVAAICLILSGIKGIIDRVVSPETQGCPPCESRARRPVDSSQEATGAKTGGRQCNSNAPR